MIIKKRHHLSNLPNIYVKLFLITIHVKMIASCSEPKRRISAAEFVVYS